MPIGKFKMITPATMFNLYEKKKIAIVNTINNPYFVTKLPFDDKFLKVYYDHTFIDCKLKFSKFDLIIFYCANYTCSAANNYAEKFLKKYPKLQDKVILYEGGLYEWSSLALNYQDFGIYNMEKEKICDKNELYKINQNFSHWLESKKKGFPKFVKDNSGPDDFYKDLQKVPANKLGLKLLDGKVCVVTGATSGLGLETLQKMLDYGAKHVTGTFYNNKKRASDVYKMLIKKYDKSRIKIIRADARTETGNDFVFNPKNRSTYLKKECVPINCVNINAGIFGPANIFKKHIFNINDKDYDQVMNLNLRGYYLGVKHFTHQAIKNNVSDGSIVCIKSIYGSTGSLFSNVAYQISKHGTMGLVRQAAVEMARPNKKLGLKHKIRVNAVSPTFTDTALTRPLLKHNLIKSTIAKSNTTGELARKEDVANAVIYLLSELSGSVTGIDLPVDCGVLSESVPTYEEVKILNNDEKIDELSCCGNTI